jgi:hypothetical protein
VLQTRPSHHPVNSGCEFVHRPASPVDALLLSRNRYARRFRNLLTVDGGIYTGGDDIALGGDIRGGGPACLPKADQLWQHHNTRRRRAFIPASRAHL